MKRFNISKKSVVIAATLLAVLFIASGVSFALMKNTSNKLENEFDSGTVDCEVVEEPTGETKVENTGTYSEYVRATVIAMWQNSKGEIAPYAPVLGTDYTMTFNTTDWFEKDGIYICKKALAVGETSPKLLSGVASVSGKVPEGYTLTVEVTANGIQSAPAEAVETAWGVTVANDGTLTAGE